MESGSSDPSKAAVARAMTMGRVRGALMAGLLVAPLLGLAQVTPAAAAEEPWIDTS